ncbi:MAG TPA: hypothetical protein VNE62_10300 [Actinomycetota bacterium]|nr:hypothetical protein [Actinomycetota bacterium]
MARKRKWFLLGILGAVAGMAMKLVRGRREEYAQLGLWETPQPEPERSGAS